jgi:hypothetical protein
MEGISGTRRIWKEGQKVEKQNVVRRWENKRLKSLKSSIVTT